MKMVSRWLVVAALALSANGIAYALDTDNDGLDDTVETNTGIYNGPLDTGTDPLNLDTDGDYYDDGFEVSSGSHPLDPAIAPSWDKHPSDLLISNTACSDSSASVAWNGTDFGVAWADCRDNGYGEIYFGRISPSGQKIGPDVRITTSLWIYSGLPSLAWNGSGYGLSWVEGGNRNEDIKFIRLNPNGGLIGSISVIGHIYEIASGAKLLWDGSGYGLFWRDGRGQYELYFVLLDSTGMQIGSSVRISNAQIRGATVYSFDIVWTGLEYGVVWYEDYFLFWCWDDGYGGGECYWESSDYVVSRTLSWDGTPTSPENLLTPFADGFFSHSPAISYNQNSYFYSWIDSSYGVPQTVQFYSPSGTPFLRERINPHSTRISQAGNAVGLTWIENSLLYLINFSSTGTALETERSVMPLNSFYDMAWGDTYYGIVWRYSSGSIYSIYFTLVSFDTDGDGLEGSLEDSVGTSTQDWDTDDDTISDGDEYWNPTLDPLAPDVLCNDPAVNFGLFCWGDAEGDGILTNLDIGQMLNWVLGRSSIFSAVYPSNSDTLDLDGDGSVTNLDIGQARNLVLGRPATLAPPSSLMVLTPMGSPVVPVDGTVTITVQALDADGTPRSGVGVVFEITGNGRLLGGRGNAAGLADPDGGTFPANSRWDITGPIADGGVASITVKVTGTGPITVTARVPQRPEKLFGSSISIPTPVTINP